MICHMTICHITICHMPLRFPTNIHVNLAHGNALSTLLDHVFFPAVDEDQVFT